MKNSIPFIDQTDEHVELLNACARIFNQQKLNNLFLCLYVTSIGAENVQEICAAVRFWTRYKRNFPMPIDLHETIQYMKKNNILANFTQ